MNYYNLKSIIASDKNTFHVQNESDSFYLAQKRDKPYIEPNFARAEKFETEKPAIILVSAVGATGKSALAQVLSIDTGLPLLDLSKHKPVGDNTLSGLITSSFDVQDLSNIFDGLRKGTYGVIIDGIDEGRSKTNEKAFDAFLDDIIKISGSSSSTSVILLGRTQILEECWLYFTDKGISTGLINILPFGLDKAREYIDVFTGGLETAYNEQYKEVRDIILEMLRKAFGEDSTTEDKDLLSFIGYPPVLDAIVTLLNEERNYHKLKEEIQSPSSNNVEIELLNRISNYILNREKEQKVIPNIVDALVSEMPEQMGQAIVDAVFKEKEQCMRLVSFCLGRKLNLDIITDRSVNGSYEKQLDSWLPEHPFITGRKFRNAVFESVAIATLMASGDPHCENLVIDYVASHKYSYHLIYLLNVISITGYLPIRYLHIILGSALEFRSTTTTVELRVDGPEVDAHPTSTPDNEVEIQIEIFFGDSDKPKNFIFHSSLDGKKVNLGRRLSSTYISLPCDIVLSAVQEIEFTAPVEISAARIILQSPALVLKHHPQYSPDQQVMLEAESIETSLEHIFNNNVPLHLIVANRTGITYPAINYIAEKGQLPTDPLLEEKFLRLKRILVEFRSHSRGTMARYKNKIENERILRNETGRKVLQRLLSDNILKASGSFYYLQPEMVNTFLSISWLDLRTNHISERLSNYLQSIA